MNIITQTFKKHLRLVNDYKLASLVILFSFGLILWNGYNNHSLLHSTGYIFAVWLGAFATDVVVGLHPKPAIGFPIKKPVNRELFTILLCSILGVLFLVYRFHSNWNELNNSIKLCLLPFFLFVFPVILAVIFLFRYKYKPKELGINFRYWYLALVMHLIVGGITYCVAPDKIHWKEWFPDPNYLGSMLDLVVTGVLGAALSEEFLRMLLQTRLGKAFNNMGLGFVVASIIWAAMHIPVETRHDASINWVAVIEGLFTMLPIGLMWGYITHRTKSLIPAILTHGFNLWGLQNI